MFPAIRFIKSPINCGAIAMVGGLILVPLISLITPKMAKEKVEDMFSCYGEKVVVTKKTVLVEDEDEAEDK
jgi:SSS family solute:Na+ symporter